MAETIENTVSYLLAAMIHRVSNAGTLSDADPELVDLILKSLVESRTENDQILFTRNHTKYPGYIIANKRGKNIYIPVNLIDFFPDGEYLEYLVETASRICADGNHTICISGSTAAGVDATADLDFCEYVLHSGKRLASTFYKAHGLSSSLCVKVAHADFDLSGSEISDEEKLRELCVTDTGTISGRCTCEKTSWMFDFVMPGFGQGLIPVTNICVNEDDAEAYSWPFQEAAIGDDHQPVGNLSDPYQFSKYVFWLKSEAEYYRTIKPIKALKRAYSLARILFRQKLTRSLNSLLNSASAKTLCQNEAYEEVRTFLRNCGSKESEHVLAGLEKPKKISEFHNNKLIKKAEDLVIEVVQDFDNLMSQASRF